ncbi:MAG: hypothetical protein Q7U47_10455 [Paludibacter sp.]|nr:hypothetical protein [Paludibacter sp.]
MKKITVTTLSLFMTSILYGQSIVENIKKQFSILDSINYIENVKSEYKQNIEKTIKETNDLIIELNRNDSLNLQLRAAMKYNLESDISKNASFSDFISMITNSKILFVLNFEIHTTKIHTNDYFKIEPHYFKYHLYCFDKKKYPSNYVFFYSGELDSYSNYPTFSRKYLSQVQYAYKMVMRKEPQYLLFCWTLPNSVVYVLNDKIYVYRVMQRKIYELDEYVKLFSHTIRKD